MVAARGSDGAFVHYGLIENDHANHILDVSTAPASVPPQLLTEAIEMTYTVLTALEVVGVLCVEFFLAENGRLLLNEMAPRPHNSGHLTIDACPTSQFGQQLRAVCGLPLGDPTFYRPAAMANLLGDLWFRQGQPHLPNWTAVLSQPQVNLHLYGKSEARNGRKMGHLTALADTVSEAKARVIAARGMLS
jgi:5-(carboxyamino)imidazole ribonucleotide synthase